MDHRHPPWSTICDRILTHGPLGRYVFPRDIYSPKDIRWKDASDPEYAFDNLNTSEFLIDLDAARSLAIRTPETPGQSALFLIFRGAEDSAKAANYNQCVTLLSPTVRKNVRVWMLKRTVEDRIRMFNMMYKVPGSQAEAGFLFQFGTVEKWRRTKAISLTIYDMIPSPGRLGSDLSSGRPLMLKCEHTRPLGQQLPKTIDQNMLYYEEDPDANSPGFDALFVEEEKKTAYVFQITCAKEYGVNLDAVKTLLNGDRRVEGISYILVYPSRATPTPTLPSCPPGYGKMFIGLDINYYGAGEVMEFDMDSRNSMF